MIQTTEQTTIIAMSFVLFAALLCIASIVLYFNRNKLKEYMQRMFAVQQETKVTLPSALLEIPGVVHLECSSAVDLQEALNGIQVLKQMAKQEIEEQQQQEQPKENNIAIG